MDYAGIFIERKDGKMLFQLRDNNPRITNPNLWGLFGGGIKTGESPKRAAVRELKEELGITIKEEQLRHWLTIPDFKKRNYLYKLRVEKQVDPKQLREGADAGYFTIQEMRKKKNVVKTLRLLLYVYPLLAKVRKKDIEKRI